MIKRINSVIPRPDLILEVSFDDGCNVLYDVKDDLSLPGYDALRTVPGLFQSVQLDPSRTVVFWSASIDLPADILHEYGKHLEPVTT